MKTNVTMSEYKAQNIYSLKQFTAFAAGDPESLREILISFISSGKKNIKIFRQYIEDENVIMISELSHQMLPLFRQIEANDIAELLSGLEQQGDFRLDNKQYYLFGRLVLEKIEALLHIIQTEENIKVG